jgi:hypothetical protein
VNVFVQRWRAPFTGILGALDLGEIPLVEQRELDLPRLDQLADGRGPAAP